MPRSIDLNTLFSTITKELTQNKEVLNKADSYNHNHGDNMVQIFNLVQNAVAQRSEKPVENQLSYASQVVKEKTNSGSAKLYAQGLQKAAKNLSGQDLNEKSIGTLLQSLMGLEQPQPQPQTQSEDILGSLLSGLVVQSSEPDQSDKSLDLDDLMQAGKAFFQSKQSGDSNMEAIMSALMAASPMAETSHRAQSASIITSTIMSFVGNSGK